MVFLAKQAALQSSLHVAIKYIPKQTIYDSKGIAKTQQVRALTLNAQQHKIFCLLTRVSTFSPPEPTGNECTTDV